MEALKAALANGADAVYLGAAAFGARANAGFDEKMLKEALSLAHLHRRKIYVTVNILVKERELSDVKKTLALLADLGADAVLVQDLGILKICREEFPQLPVHASTQMALHHASGARLLKSLGAQRVVLARECDLDAMRQAAQTGIEIEAFCHGAMCVSVSGQCLFSSMIGGRSGNRGRCAQPCRLNYTYQGKTGAWLSPRDLCARDSLLQMAKAGVYSFKIEGRLKRPEYVAVVTRAYRNALDDILDHRFSPADTEEKESLVQIFSRGGFTQGYPGKERDAAIVDPGRVTPIGLPMGQVEKTYQKGGALLADVRLSRALHHEDGLEIGRQELRYSGPECPAGSVAALRLRDPVKKGEMVRRTEDEAQLRAARATYDGEAFHAALPIRIHAELIAYPGKPLMLSVTDGESRAQAQGEICQSAQNKPLDAENARRALGKTGGTPFVLQDLKLKSRDAFVPAAALNALRREALEALSEARIAAHPRAEFQAAQFSAASPNAIRPRLIVRTQNLDELTAFIHAGADEILYAPQDYREEALMPILKHFPGKTRLCIPSQCKEETLQKLCRWTNEAKIPVCLGSPGQIGVFSGDVMAGEGVPVMNGESIKMLSCLGCSAVTLSREMSRQDILDLPAGNAELILPVYGRTRLMILNHCPMRTMQGMKAGRENCHLCELGKGAMHTGLTDRMQEYYPLFPIRLPEGCLMELMGSQPLHLSGQLKDLPPLTYLVNFWDENQAERLAIIAHYAALLRGETPKKLEIRGTMGRFHEGVI